MLGGLGAGLTASSVALHPHRYKTANFQPLKRVVTKARIVASRQALYVPPRNLQLLLVLCTGSSCPPSR